MPAPSEIQPPFALVDRLRAGETLFSGWVCNPEPLFCELVASGAVDAVVLDAQHGLHDLRSLERCIAAVAGAGKPALVRLPVGGYSLGARALDFGAAGLIAPMINSAADARAFAETVKYPPCGFRSWGPSRAPGLSGVTDAGEHLRRANDFTLALAMIETAVALEAVDEILAVDGIDGAFVGPYDLSVGLSKGAFVDPDAEIVVAALDRIVAALRKAGKIGGIFGGDRAHERAARGFTFVSAGMDGDYVRAGVAAIVGRARGGNRSQRP